MKVNLKKHYYSGSSKKKIKILIVRISEMNKLMCIKLIILS